MALRILTAAAFFGLMLIRSSDAAIVIQDDMGGPLGDYLMKYSNIRKSGQLVIIDGRCYSACTIVTGSVPPRNICVTPRAVLGFHAASANDQWGSSVASNAATRTLYNLYPRHIQKWLNQNGGLGTRTVLLDGRDLAKMYPMCPQHADALSSKRPVEGGVFSNDARLRRGLR